MVSAVLAFVVIALLVVACVIRFRREIADLVAVKAAYIRDIHIIDAISGRKLCRMRVEEAKIVYTPGMHLASITCELCLGIHDTRLRPIR